MNSLVGRPAESATAEGRTANTATAEAKETHNRRMPGPFLVEGPATLVPLLQGFKLVNLVPLK
jgi:hypothetical protein